jgi:succinate dehydrogenase hydrophobic anchor subunit
MNTRRILLLLVIIFILLWFKPATIWAEMKRSWKQREWILKIMVVIISIYLVYGVYSMYKQGMLDWLW